LIRRQPPFDSPNCTRVFGPTDAMMRAPGLALARTITQLREVVVTQRELVLRAELFGAAGADFANVFG
jgi:hypothetical protein